MVKIKTPRIPDDLAVAIEKDVKNRGFSSENEWWVKAAQHFLTCKKLDFNAPMRLIVLRYPAKCLKCNRSIAAGEWALYGRGVGAICMDCYVERIGDKALVAKYLKLREYKRMIKALKNEADRLADKIEILTLADKFDKQHKAAEQVHGKVLSFLKEKIGTPQEQEALEDIIRLTKKEFVLIADIEQFFEKYLKTKTKIKTKPYEV